MQNVQRIVTRPKLHLASVIRPMGYHFYFGFHHLHYYNAGALLIVRDSENRKGVVRLAAYKRGLGPQNVLDSDIHKSCIEVWGRLCPEAGIMTVGPAMGIILKGNEIYVKEYPCLWCAPALARTEVRRVYYQIGDPHYEGEVAFKESGIEVVRVRA